MSFRVWDWVLAGLERVLFTLATSALGRRRMVGKGVGGSIDMVGQGVGGTMEMAGKVLGLMDRVEKILDGDIDETSKKATFTMGEP